ncbi:DUF5125 domain-containing protein [Bacteroides sp. CG01]|uniref:DUF5125 domain-containing protein n=1 Tax=Bacteroides TaxID=816 RepID=UPI00259D0C47|nr:MULTISPECIES: DUF5125 domain-containing protein [Bacteroides]
MKKNIYLALALAGVLSVTSCNDDEWNPGNPGMDVKTEDADALFGDSLPFTVKASDLEVPLSTLKAQLFYGEEKVSETVIRTKTSGEDYTGKIYIPFLPNIANGKATLKYVLQNIHFTTTETEQEISLARPDFPYLTLVTEDNVEYRMERTEAFQYNVTNEFPQKLKAYIKAPKMGENGNELVFGWDNDNQIAVRGDNTIAFSNTDPGAYEIKFNTFSYEASPFVKLLVNGEEMDMVDANTYTMDLSLKTNDLLEITGVPDYDNWYIDPDYFSKEADGKLKFLPIGGSYRIKADMKLQYFSIVALKDGAPAALQTDGTGAIWVIGDGVGKPSLSGKEVGWTTENGLCMSQITAKKYQITLVAGRSLKASSINFKFFHQQGWGGEFGSDALTTSSDLVGIGTGGDTGHDNGNLYLLDGKSFTEGHAYKFVVDVTKGISSAVLTVTDEGAQQIEIENINFGGVKMASTDGETYTATLAMTQNQSVTVTGIDDLASWYVDPDFFTNNDGQLTFLPVGGDYQAVANISTKVLSAVRMSGGALAGLDNDGHGSILVLGWGLARSSMDNQFAWDLNSAYRMAEISPKVYRFSGVVGPEAPSAIGKRIRCDYISCKFYASNGWDYELKLTVADDSKDLIEISGDGNIGYKAGATLEDGVEAVLTLDMTAGNDKGIISLVRK